MVRVTLLAVTRPPSLPEMPMALPPAPGDPADQFLVDRAAQHHFGHFGRGLVGHPQAIDEARFDAQLS